MKRQARAVVPGPGPPLRFANGPQPLDQHFEPGLLPLREAICEDYRARYGVAVSPDQVIVTQGTSPAMLLLFSTLLEEGDGVILSDPAYACYDNFIRFAGACPVRVPR